MIYFSSSQTEIWELTKNIQDTELVFHDFEIATVAHAIKLKNTKNIEPLSLK